MTLALGLVVPGFCASGSIGQCQAAGEQQLLGICCCRTACDCGAACNADDRPAKESEKGSPTSEASARDGGKFTSAAVPAAFQIGSQHFSGFDLWHFDAGLRLQTLVALHTCLQV